VVANSTIELELCGRKLRMTLSLTIRHQYLFKDEPTFPLQKTKGSCG